VRLGGTVHSSPPEPFRAVPTPAPSAAAVCDTLLQSFLHTIRLAKVSALYATRPDPRKPGNPDPRKPNARVGECFCSQLGVTDRSVSIQWFREFGSNAMGRLLAVLFRTPGFPDPPDRGPSGCGSATANAVEVGRIPLEGMGPTPTGSQLQTDATDWSLSCSMARGGFTGNANRSVTVWVGDDKCR